MSTSVLSKPKPKATPTEADFETWFRAKHGRKPLCHAVTDDIRARQEFFDAAAGKKKPSYVL